MPQNLVLQGTSISSGIAIGKVCFLFEKKKAIPAQMLSSKDVEKEIQRYRSALKKSREDLEHLQKRYIKDGTAVVVEILDAHLEILQDPFITDLVEEKIKVSQRNTEVVFHEVIDDYQNCFKNVEDEFVKERVKDIKDISNRILRHLNPFKEQARGKIENNSIIMAKELIPSNAFDYQYKEAIGFISQKGGYTSHIGIISRAKGVPYVAKIDVNKIKSIDIKKVIIDGMNGQIIINPDQKTLDKYLSLQTNYFNYFNDIKKNEELESTTKDKVKIKIFANIASITDLSEVLKKKAAGIGLFRSEYLFLTENEFPTEERQFSLYKEMLQKMKGKSVVIRLFDIGGDKNFFFFQKDQKDLISHNEQNPALGCGGIRFLLKNKELFQEQLRALLRASIYGNLKILIPFVCDLEEIREVKKTIDKLKKQLNQEGKKTSDKIALGCMVEIPSVAIMADVFAKEVDFFSIGTNDLTQYVLAADRANPEVSNLYDFANPSLFKLLKNIIKAAKKHKKEVTLCGEMAADPKFTKILIGMGIKNFSVSSLYIPTLKYTIREMKTFFAKVAAKKVLNFKDSSSIRNFLEKEKIL